MGSVSCAATSLRAVGSATLMIAAGTSDSPFIFRTGKHTGFSLSNVSRPMNTAGREQKMSVSWTMCFLFNQAVSTAAVESLISTIQSCRAARPNKTAVFRMRPTQSFGPPPDVSLNSTKSPRL